MVQLSDHPSSIFPRFLSLKSAIKAFSFRRIMPGSIKGNKKFQHPNNSSKNQSSPSPLKICSKKPSEKSEWSLRDPIIIFLHSFGINHNGTAVLILFQSIDSLLFRIASLCSIQTECSKFSWGGPGCTCQRFFLWLASTVVFLFKQK